MQKTLLGTNHEFNPADMPFGIEAELKRIALEREAEQEETTVSRLRREIEEIRANIKREERGNERYASRSQGSNQNRSETYSKFNYIHEVQ